MVERGLNHGRNCRRGRGTLVWYWQSTGRSVDHRTESTQMRPRLQQWLVEQQGDMVEGAMTLPIMALVSFWHWSILHWRAMPRSRPTMQSTTLHGWHRSARTMPQTKHSPPPTRRSLPVLATMRSRFRRTISGGTVRVRVQWQVPNFFGSLMPLFGKANLPLQGEAVSVFPQGGVVKRQRGRVGERC